ncbi:MAG: DUF423 domain-containing protein [Flavobacteriales bacterium]|nr:DUF423 domain-containing protein [Flavobacteriales bacterium]
MREYIIHPSLPILMMAAGIALDAFGAHGLKEHIDENSINIWEKGVYYQLVNAAALLSISLYQQQFVYLRQRWAAILVVAGTFLFSISLYFLATDSWMQWPFAGILGPITPFGGLLMISGWIWMALTFGKRSQIMFRD